MEKNLSMEPIFQLLADEDDPEPGIFFIQAGGFPVAKPGARATGMAALIGSDGLAVTCSHVVLAAGYPPGSVVTLYGSDPSMPIAVEAEVLADGWCGPDWTKVAGSKSTGADLLNRVSREPDVLREDLAFLRLRPGTARWDGARQPLEGTDPQRLLLQRARVLPLGSPAYPSGADISLKAWAIGWELKRPLMLTGNAAWLGVEPRLHGVVRFRSKEIQPGFSGSPLWDKRRGRVVGVVRRGIKTFIPDAMLATDSRFVAHQARVRLRPDAQADVLLNVFARTVEYAAPLRHFPLLQARLPDRLVPMKITQAPTGDLLEELPDRAGEPAVSRILSEFAEEGVLVLSGGAGSGKSTLLYVLARHLLENDVRIASSRLVPIFVAATELERSGFDLAAILKERAAKYSFAADDVSLLATLTLNELCPLIMLDGLDEIDRMARSRVLARLKEIRNSVHEVRILVGTRPFDDIATRGTGRSVQNWKVLNLLHFTGEQVATLAELWFSETEERARFTELLASIEWDKAGPTPLQLALAAALFGTAEGLPQRPVDLPFAFVDHLLLLGQEEEDRQKAGRGPIQLSKTDLVYRQYLRPILRRLAVLHLDGGDEKGILANRLAKSGSEEWLDDPVGLLRFLERETTLLGGVIVLEEAQCAQPQLIWPHRTIAEVLAAEELADRASFRPIEGLASFQKSVRAQGQGFAITLLAAMDRQEGGSAGVNLSLARTLENGTSDWKATILAVRALGAGIRVSEDLRRRLVRTLITLLLLPEGARLGQMQCSEVFSSDDLPSPIQIARRRGMRALLVEQLNERWRLRDPRKRGAAPPLYISEREALLLDRLDLWSDMEIPVARPTARTSSPSAKTRAHHELLLGAPHVPAALLSYALERLRADSDGFLAGLAVFARTAGGHLPPEKIGAAYLATLMMGDAQRPATESSNGRNIGDTSAISGDAQSSAAS